MKSTGRPSNRVHHSNHQPCDRLVIGLTTVGLPSLGNNLVMVISQMLREVILTREARLATSGAFDHWAVIFFVHTPSVHTLVVPIFVGFARESSRAFSHRAPKFFTAGDN